LFLIVGDKDKEWKTEMAVSAGVGAEAGAR